MLTVALSVIRAAQVSVRCPAVGHVMALLFSRLRQLRSRIGRPPPAQQRLAPAVTSFKMITLSDDGQSIAFREAQWGHSTLLYMTEVVLLLRREEFTMSAYVHHNIRLRVIICGRSHKLTPTRGRRW